MITTTTKKGALQISSDVKDFTIQNKNVQCLMKREKKLYWNFKVLKIRRTILFRYVTKDTITKD